jgi:hypothetical protein
MCLQFGLVIFWQKDFGAKAAHKMLVKLPPGGSMGPGSFFKIYAKICITEQGSLDTKARKQLSYAATDV